MSDYDVGLACLNGHRINGSSRDYPQFNTKYCESCGRAAIDACPACAGLIRGSYRGGFSTTPWEPAPYCTQCGTPFPWVAERLAAARMLAEELEGLTADERDQVKLALPDLVADSPMTSVSAVRFKRLMGKAGVTAAGGFKDILVGIATEGAKRQIWGP